MYAIEGSEGAAASARQVVLANGLSSKVKAVNASKFEDHPQFSDLNKVC